MYGTSLLLYLLAIFSSPGAMGVVASYCRSRYCLQRLTSPAPGDCCQTRGSQNSSSYAPGRLEGRSLKVLGADTFCPRVSVQAKQPSLRKAIVKAFVLFPKADFIVLFPQRR